MNRTYLIDLDDTLVKTPDYQMTTQGLEVVIDECTQHGMSIGLNSDSPLPWLLEWYETLHMNGPIVAEGGAILQVGSSEPIYTVPGKKVARLVDNALLLCEKAHQMGALSLYGDVVRERRNGIRMSTREPFIVAVNALRQASLMCYVWKTTQCGTVQPHDATHIDLMGRHLKEVFTQPEYRVEQDYSCGVVVVHTAETTKQHGVQRLRSLQPDVPITMIGNSISDWCGDCVEHVSVSNASAEFANHCAVRLSRPWTEGVKDYLLTQISRPPS